ncbi:MAG: hypothetical protein PHS30_02770 [Bacteroidales bacterium]|nr:hypothetical protein [Bacteroidales bacterium]
MKLNGHLIHYGSNPSQNYNYAVSAIDRHLDEGRPIMVGVNHTIGNTINEKTTDHLVVITGRDYDSSNGQYYYTYIETGRYASQAAAACDTNNNRFYYDPNTLSLTDDSVLKHDKGYTVTQVRPNDGIITNTVSQYKSCQ